MFFFSVVWWLCACLCDVDGVVAVAWEQGAKEEGGRGGRVQGGGSGRGGGEEGERGRGGGSARMRTPTSHATPPPAFSGTAVWKQRSPKTVEINPETLKALNLKPYTS